MAQQNNGTATANGTASTAEKTLPPNWNLSGSWQVIKERSDDLDEFFKVNGLNWATRRLLCSLNRTCLCFRVCIVVIDLFCSDLHHRSHARHVRANRQKYAVHAHDEGDVGLAAEREQEPRRQGEQRDSVQNGEQWRVSFGERHAQRQTQHRGALLGKPHGYEANGADFEQRTTVSVCFRFVSLRCFARFCSFKHEHNKHAESAKSRVIFASSRRRKSGKRASASGQQ